MKGGDNRLAFLYVASYLFLVVLASINMFIAILNDYFMKHQEQNARVSPIHPYCNRPGLCSSACSSCPEPLIGVRPDSMILDSPERREHSSSRLGCSVSTVARRSRRGSQPRVGRVPLSCDHCDPRRALKQCNAMQCTRLI